MKKKMAILLYLLPLLFYCFGCNTTPTTIYQIGIDPQWIGYELQGKEKNVMGFTTELLQDIAKKRNWKIELVLRNWDNLIDGLREEKYEGMFSNLYPYKFYQNTYDFSELYLPLGPVLVVVKDSVYTSLAMMEGKEIAVLERSEGESLVERTAGLTFRTYETIPEVLNAVVTQRVDGALLPFLEAKSYSQDLYQEQLRMILPPLKDLGIRLVSLHGEAKELIEGFNEGLSELKLSGAYDELAKKWNVF